MGWPSTDDNSARCVPERRAAAQLTSRHALGLATVSVTDQTFPWPAATATAIGSYPGADVAEATRVVLGELPRLPHLPELPARGPGADMIGRTAGLLVDLPVELQPSGWRFADRPGRDVRRGHDHLARDLDTIEEQAAGLTGPFKI